MLSVIVCSLIAVAAVFAIAVWVRRNDRKSSKPVFGPKEALKDLIAQQRVYGRFEVNAVTRGEVLLIDREQFPVDYAKSTAARRRRAAEEAKPTLVQKFGFADDHVSPGYQVVVSTDITTLPVAPVPSRTEEEAEAECLAARARSVAWYAAQAQAQSDIQVEEPKLAP